MTGNALDLMPALPVLERQQRVALHEQRIPATLKPHDSEAETLSQLDTLRAVEDCINLPFHNWRFDTVLALTGSLLLTCKSRLVRAPNLFPFRFFYCYGALLDAKL